MFSAEQSAISSEFDFALSILDKLPADKSCIVSPLSISLALSLVHSGAKGTSRKEIEQVLLNGASNEEFSQHFSNLIRSIGREKTGVKFELANRVFVRNECYLLDSYSSNIQKNYLAEAVSLNFNDKKASCETVNSFVSEVTHGKIKELVTEDFFSELSRMVLVNAVYMEGKWLNKFKATNTEPGIFNVTKKDKKQVNYLCDWRVYRDYYENDFYQLLSLKYEDHPYRFNIFLPKTKFALDNLQSRLSGDHIELVLGTRLKYESVNIKLPKFKLETEIDSMRELLNSLGLNGMFKGGEDLNGFTGNNDIFVSDAIHKAIIEVDEGGTVAAAATAVLLLGGLPPEPKNFIADHPFLFCITFNNHPVFIGKYY